MNPSSHKCRFDPAKIAVKSTGYVDITSKSENALQQAVTIDASHTSFQLYKSGSKYFS